MKYTQSYKYGNHKFKVVVDLHTRAERHMNGNQWSKIEMFGLNNDFKKSDEVLTNQILDTIVFYQNEARVFVSNGGGELKIENDLELLGFQETK